MKPCLDPRLIVKLANPTSSMPPLLFRLADELDHLYGSKWLIELYRLGFLISYSEVTRFKQAVMSSQSLDSQTTLLSSENAFIQYIADNVDHNIATLDGKDTFHGMGIIAARTNQRGNIIKELIVKRPKNLLKTEY